MENYDTGRMRRVLDRVYPQGMPSLAPPRPPEDEARRPHGPGPAHREEELRELLRRELWLRAALEDLMRRSGLCRTALGDVLRRVRRRIRNMETELYMDTGRVPRIRDAGYRRRGGVIAGLRQLASGLERQAEAYADAGEESSRRGRFTDLSRECARDAEAVRALLERSMR